MNGYIYLGKCIMFSLNKLNSKLFTKSGEWMGEFILLETYDKDKISK